MVRNNILLFLKMYCNILICIFISADIFCTEVVQFELHYILVADWKIKARRLAQYNFEELPLLGGTRQNMVSQDYPLDYILQCQNIMQKVSSLDLIIFKELKTLLENSTILRE